MYKLQYDLYEYFNFYQYVWLVAKPVKHLHMMHYNKTTATKSRLKQTEVNWPEHLPIVMSPIISLSSQTIAPGATLALKKTKHNKT